MRRESHVRFGGRAEETDRPKGRHRASARPYTEHPTREGKVYCAVVLDVFSRRVVGWSIDASPTAALVTNALGMAIEERRPDGTVIHSDQGTQGGFVGWTRPHRPPGRPAIDPQVCKLILVMARENPRWGYLRIKGELGKLGIRASATSIAMLLRRS